MTRLCLSTLTFLFSSTRLLFSFEFSKVVVSVSSLRRRIPMRRIKISSLRLNLLCPFQRLRLVTFARCRFPPFFLGSTHKYIHVTRVIDVLDHVNRITSYQKSIMSACTPLFIIHQSCTVHIIQCKFNSAQILFCIDSLLTRVYAPFAR